MNATIDHDVIILGGGLAGLTLGIQLLRQRPTLRVAALERATFPRPEATLKVGESTVEIGGLYFADVVGMRDVLNASHLPKLGLRYFFDDGDNRDLGVRSEFGPSHFLPTRTWQIDRGRFENQLAERFAALGGTLLQGAKVGDVDLGEPHRVHFQEGGARRSLSARWVVDAGGRRALLKKQLGLAKRVNHRINASWWRVDEAIDLDGWSSDAGFRAAAREPRRLSTNHLMGEGYWVWLIPLSSGGTSVGIVADDDLHPFGTIRTADASDAWLREHEPQLADVLAQGTGRQDFLTLGKFTHAAKRVYSKDRWAMVGDAGVFLDPFYSPGSDFIALANTMVGDAIVADHDGDADAAARVEMWNRRMLLLFRSFLATYRGRYPLMGRPEVMRSKILWDIALYWSSHALMFARGRAADGAFLEASRKPMAELLVLNLEVQNLFSRWGDVAPRRDEGCIRTDYASIPWMRELNAALTLDEPSDVLLDRLVANIGRLGALAGEIEARALTREAGLGRLGVDVPREATGLASAVA